MLRTLKKFFLDSPIECTKKIYFWLYYLLGVRFSILYLPYYYWYVIRPIRVGTDGRVGMLQLISDVVYGCNLRCEFCMVFSPYRKGYIPVGDLLTSYRQWRKKIKPQYFKLTGGEPLLHPELAELLRESAKIWDDAKLWINTNGLLLNSVSVDVLHAIKETGYALVITEHTFEPEHREKLDAGYARLKKEGIRFVVRPSRLSWLAMYHQEKNGERKVFMPYRSNPQRAWNHCVSRHCMAIIGHFKKSATYSLAETPEFTVFHKTLCCSFFETGYNGEKLYKCNYLSAVHDGLREGVLDTEHWKNSLTYQPLTLQSTAEEISTHLRTHEIPACTICYEKRQTIISRQIPLTKPQSSGSK